MRKKTLPVLMALIGGLSSTLTHALDIKPAVLTEVNVPGTTAMTAAPVDLAAAGYTEREYYAEGTANRYRGAVLDNLKTAEVIDNKWHYLSRVLVRTPKPEKFNGTLVVEWANVTAGQDVDFAFAESYEYLLREGYAVAVVSAQRNGVERLKSWSPARYGKLTVDADNADPRDGSVIDVCIDTAHCVSDPLSWDIMTQITKALKENTGKTQPLPGLTVKHTIALGESQSAMRLTSYYNTIQPLYNVFDGFVFLDIAGQLRADQKVPAISVNSEVTATRFPVRTTSEYTRIWAMPGASHASIYGVKYVDDMLVRDNSFPGKQGPLSFTDIVNSQQCKLSPPFSRVDSGLVLNAALNSVNQWVSTGKVAAPSMQIVRNEAGAIVRDAQGNAQGGVRLAQFVAPTALFSTNSPGMACELSGHHRDLTANELKSRYGNHDGYVSLVRSTLRQLRENGYILPFDEAAEVKAAELSNVAR